MKLGQKFRTQHNLILLNLLIFLCTWTRSKFFFGPKVHLEHWLQKSYRKFTHNLFPRYLALVPAPAVFYILTAQFTDPIKIHSDWHPFEFKLVVDWRRARARLARPAGQRVVSARALVLTESGERIAVPFTFRI